MVQPASKQRLSYVDTLRFLSAATVCLFHFIEKQPQAPWMQALLTSGAAIAAVVVFFFISGLVLPYSVRPDTGLGAVMVRRLFRFFPLYYCALAVLMLGGWTGFLPSWSFMLEAQPLVWLANLAVIQDFVAVRPFLAVSWTLAIELIWSIVFLGSIALFRTRAALVVGMVAPVTMLALALASLVIGIRIPLGRPAMLYAATIGWQAYSYQQGQLSRRSLIGFIALFLVLVSATNFVSLAHFHHVRINFFPSFVAWSLATLIFAITVLSTRLRAARWVSGGIFPMLGLRGYSTYLLHPIALALMPLHFGGYSFLGRLVIYVAMVAALSEVGYRFVELPGIAMGRRLSRQVARGARAPSATRPVG